MTPFINDDFLLQNRFAIRLYHEFAENLPIIDYHNHLSPQDISDNKKFENLTQIWLEGDHYKWRAMRANGVDEHYISGDADDWEKFEKWAETVPNTMRNPLYHWTHLELKRYFGINKLLTPDTAKDIYFKCSEMLRTEEFSTQNLLRKMRVEVVCTTDDPTDKLHYHKNIQANSIGTKVLPTFRTDDIFLSNNSLKFKKYIKKLELSSSVKISTLIDFIEAIKMRLDYFEAAGCVISDYGLSEIPPIDFNIDILSNEFEAWVNDENSDFLNMANQFNGLIILQLSKLYHEKDMVQQFHLGAIRNNNSRLLNKIGYDAGCDSIGDYSHAERLSAFLNALDKEKKLAKTILYNLNPRDNEVFSTMTGNFQMGDIPGKIQWGSAWWFLDQKDGMEKQINTLSNTGLLSRFIGMITDSRSFLSFPRHEYFRRILCNIIGTDIEKGFLPNDIKFLGEMINNISYFNSRKYLFGK